LTLSQSSSCSSYTCNPPGNPPIASQAGSRPLSPPPPVANPTITPTPSPSNSGDLGAILQRLEQETSGLNADVGKLRVEKWKVDSATKHQASENIGSVQR